DFWLRWPVVYAVNSPCENHPPLVGARHARYLNCTSHRGVQKVSLPAERTGPPPPCCLALPQSSLAGGSSKLARTCCPGVPRQPGSADTTAPLPPSVSVPPRSSPTDGR